MRAWEYYLSVYVKGNIECDIPQGAGPAESRKNGHKNRKRIFNRSDLWKLAGTCHRWTPHSREVQSAHELS